MQKTLFGYLGFCFSIAGSILFWESIRGLFHAQVSMNEVLGDFRFYFGFVFLVAAIILTSLDIKKRK
jgi:hypothetical protein